MKKFLPYILIVFTLVNFLAPVSIGISNANRIVVNKNVASAEEVWDGSINGYKNAFPNSAIQAGAIFIDESRVNLDITVKIDTGLSAGTDSSLNWIHIKPESSSNALNDLTWGLAGGTTNEFKKNNALVLKFVESGTNQTGLLDVSNNFWNMYDADTIRYGEKRLVPRNQTGMPVSITYTTYNPTVSGIPAFKPNTSYNISFYYLACTSSSCGLPDDSGDEDLGLNNGKNYFKIAEVSITTPKDSTTQSVTGDMNNTGNQVVPGRNADTMPTCGIDGWPEHLGGNGGTIKGCVAQILYYFLFVPTSFVFALAGNFFDWTFAYSVSDSSYRSDFVMNGWALVRDFCNMFFIFILLYVAFSTIIGNNGSKTKEMIMNVVIIGLLINFSLFATQIIIDTSNILARVFYNSNAISITQKGGKAEPANGVTNVTAGGTTTPSDPAVTGILPLSAAIVNKINPQNLIINSADVSTVGDSSIQDPDSEKSLSVGRFMLVILLSTAVNCVGIFVFLVVALIFVARVVGLWIAMIMSPLAFFSFMVPKLKSIQTVGWDKWLPETISLAFLAPVFIFFLYIILKFLETGMVFIDQTTAQGGIKMIIATIVPFAFLMILMLRAKDIAKNMSGEMGKMITGAIAAVGGVALGAATGGLAMAGRATLGRAGNAIAGSERLKKMETNGNAFQKFAAKNLRNVGNSASDASFDARNVKAISGAFDKEGIKMGKAGGGGGFTKKKADQIIYRQKRAKDLELGEDSAQVQAVRQAELALNTAKTDPNTQRNLVRLNAGEDAATHQATLNAANAALAANPNDPVLIAAANAAAVSAQGLGTLERNVATAERAVADAERALRDAISATPQDPVAIQTARDTQDRAVAARNIAISNLTIRQEAIRTAEGPLHRAENALKLAQSTQTQENNERKRDYAASIQGNWSNTINMITSGGQHSISGEREAANRILAGVQPDVK